MEHSKRMGEKVLWYDDEILLNVMFGGNQTPRQKHTIPTMKLDAGSIML